jgi:integrase
VAVGDALCGVPGCGFPALGAPADVGLCDQHLRRYYSWRSSRSERDPDDRSGERYIESLSARADKAVLMRLELPQAPVLSLELRYVLQSRHDGGDGHIDQVVWQQFIARLETLAVGSVLDRDEDAWRALGPDVGRQPPWMYYLRYAWQTLLALQVRGGVKDAWADDVWYARTLPIDEIPLRLSRFDWRPVGPVWLRELCKRWARQRLRGGLSTSHVNAVRGAVIHLAEFCEQAAWPLDDVECLTRELFDAFLDDVRGAEWGVKHKRQTVCGVKQLFEESHDFGWIRLRNPRVYLPGELPSDRGRLPRDLPAEIVKRLNEPGALGLLGVRERAAVLILMDCGLRATDTARLRADALITGSDGAPYLRYWNHKRRREAIVPISDRAAEAIAAHRAWVDEHYPGCEWLFPRLNANGRGQRPMGYPFIIGTLHRWSEELDLRDRRGDRVRLQAHAFRHTYACAMVNQDVDLFSVQSLLDHDSPEMTWRYARMSKETLRRRWEQGQQRINIRGEVVPLDIDGELSDAAWAKEQLSRATQSLANGWCALPLQQVMPAPKRMPDLSGVPDRSDVPAPASRAARADRAADRAGQAERQPAPRRDQRGDQGQPGGDHRARRAARTRTAREPRATGGRGCSSLSETRPGLRRRPTAAASGPSSARGGRSAGWIRPGSRSASRRSRARPASLGSSSTATISCAARSSGCAQRTSRPPSRSSQPHSGRARRR